MKFGNAKKYHIYAFHLSMILKGWQMNELYVFWDDSEWKCGYNNKWIVQKSCIVGNFKSYKPNNPNCRVVFLNVQNCFQNIAELTALRNCVLMCTWFCRHLQASKQTIHSDSKKWPHTSQKQNVCVRQAFALVSSSQPGKRVICKFIDRSSSVK